MAKRYSSEDSLSEDDDFVRTPRTQNRFISSQSNKDNIKPFSKPQPSPFQKWGKGIDSLSGRKSTVIQQERSPSATAGFTSNTRGSLSSISALTSKDQQVNGATEFRNDLSGSNGTSSRNFSDSVKGSSRTTTSRSHTLFNGQENVQNTGKDKSSTGITFSWEYYLKRENAKVCPDSWFKQNQECQENKFKPGMKLEAVDPRNSVDKSICLATVIYVLGPRLRLRLDGSDDKNDFWRLVDSDDIYPVGFCIENGGLLQPPLGFRIDPAAWPAFKKKMLTKATIAPKSCFMKEPVTPKKNYFQVGYKLEAVDKKYPHMICPATVGAVDGDMIHVEFDGWKGLFDYWCRFDNRDIFPVGWCVRMGHPLQPPGQKGTYTWKSSPSLSGNCRLGGETASQKINHGQTDPSSSEDGNDSDHGPFSSGEGVVNKIQDASSRSYSPNSMLKVRLARLQSGEIREATKDDSYRSSGSSDRERFGSKTVAEDSSSPSKIHVAGVGDQLIIKRQQHKIGPKSVMARRRESSGNFGNCSESSEDEDSSNEHDDKISLNRVRSTGQPAFYAGVELNQVVIPLDRNEVDEYLNKIKKRKKIQKKRKMESSSSDDSGSDDLFHPKARKLRRIKKAFESSSEEEDSQNILVSPNIEKSLLDCTETETQPSRLKSLDGLYRHSVDSDVTIQSVATTTTLGSAPDLSRMSTLEERDDDFLSPPDLHVQETDVEEKSCDEGGLDNDVEKNASHVTDCDSTQEYQLPQQDEKVQQNPSDGTSGRKVEAFRSTSMHDRIKLSSRNRKPLNAYRFDDSSPEKRRRVEKGRSAIRGKKKKMRGTRFEHGGHKQSREDQVPGPSSITSPARPESGGDRELSYPVLKSPAKRKYSSSDEEPRTKTASEEDLPKIVRKSKTRRKNLIRQKKEEERFPTVTFDCDSSDEENSQSKQVEVLSLSEGDDSDTPFCALKQKQTVVKEEGSSQEYDKSKKVESSNAKEACSKVAILDTIKEEKNDTEEMKDKEKDNGVKKSPKSSFSYTQEPDAIFISDNETDEELLQSLSQSSMTEFQNLAQSPASVDNEYGQEQDDSSNINEEEDLHVESDTDSSECGDPRSSGYSKSHTSVRYHIKDPEYWEAAETENSSDLSDPELLEAKERKRKQGGLVKVKSEPQDKEISVTKETDSDEDCGNGDGAESASALVQMPNNMFTRVSKNVQPSPKIKIEEPWHLESSSEIGDGITHGNDKQDDDFDDHLSSADDEDILLAETQPFTVEPGSGGQTLEMGREESISSENKGHVPNQSYNKKSRLSTEMKSFDSEDDLLLSKAQEVMEESYPDRQYKTARVNKRKSRSSTDSKVFDSDGDQTLRDYADQGFSEDIEKMTDDTNQPVGNLKTEPSFSLLSKRTSSKSTDSNSSETLISENARKLKAGTYENAKENKNVESTETNRAEDSIVHWTHASKVDEIHDSGSDSAERYIDMSHILQHASKNRNQERKKRDKRSETYPDESSKERNGLVVDVDADYDASSEDEEVVNPYLAQTQVMSRTMDKRKKNELRNGSSAVNSVIEVSDEFYSDLSDNEENVDFVVGDECAEDPYGVSTQVDPGRDVVEDVSDQEEYEDLTDIHASGPADEEDPYTVSTQVDSPQHLHKRKKNECVKETAEGYDAFEDHENPYFAETQVVDDRVESRMRLEQDEVLHVESYSDDSNILVRSSSGDDRDDDVDDAYEAQTQVDVDENDEDVLDNWYALPTQVDNNNEILDTERTSEEGFAPSAPSHGKFLSLDNRTKSFLYSESTAERSREVSKKIADLPSKLSSKSSKSRTIEIEPQKQKSREEIRQGFKMNSSKFYSKAKDQSGSRQPDQGGRKAQEGSFKGWLSKDKSPEVPKPPQRRRRGRGKSKDEKNDFLLKQRIILAKNEHHGRMMHTLANPDAVADKEKKTKDQHKAVPTISEDVDDVAPPSGSQIVRFGLPVLMEVPILTKKPKSTAPAPRFTSRAESLTADMVQSKMPPPSKKTEEKQVHDKSGAFKKPGKPVTLETVTMTSTNTFTTTTASSLSSTRTSVTSINHPSATISSTAPRKSADTYVRTSTTTTSGNDVLSSIMSGMNETLGQALTPVPMPEKKAVQPLTPLKTDSKGDKDSYKVTSSLMKKPSTKELSGKEIKEKRDIQTGMDRSHSAKHKPASDVQYKEGKDVKEQSDTFVSNRAGDGSRSRHSSAEIGKIQNIAKIASGDMMGRTEATLSDTVNDRRRHHSAGSDKFDKSESTSIESVKDHHRHHSGGSDKLGKKELTSKETTIDRQRHHSGSTMKDHSSKSHHHSKDSHDRKSHKPHHHHHSDKHLSDKKGKTPGDNMKDKKKEGSEDKERDEGKGKHHKDGKDTSSKKHSSHHKHREHSKSDKDGKMKLSSKDVEDSHKHRHSQSVDREKLSRNEKDHRTTEGERKHSNTERPSSVGREKHSGKDLKFVNMDTGMSVNDSLVSTGIEKTSVSENDTRHKAGTKDTRSSSRDVSSGKKERYSEGIEDSGAKSREKEIVSSRKDQNSSVDKKEHSSRERLKSDASKSSDIGNSSVSSGGINKHSREKEERKNSTERRNKDSTNNEQTLAVSRKDSHKESSGKGQSSAKYTSDPSSGSNKDKGNSKKEKDSRSWEDHHRRDRDKDFTKGVKEPNNNGSESHKTELKSIEGQDRVPVLKDKESSVVSKKDVDGGKTKHDTSKKTPRWDQKGRADDNSSRKSSVDQEENKLDSSRGDGSRKSRWDDKEKLNDTSREGRRETSVDSYKDNFGSSGGSDKSHDKMSGVGKSKVEYASGEKYGKKGLSSDRHSFVPNGAIPGSDKNRQVSTNAVEKKFTSSQYLDREKKNSEAKASSNFNVTKPQVNKMPEVAHPSKLPNVEEPGRGTVSPDTIRRTPDGNIQNANPRDPRHARHIDSVNRQRDKNGNLIDPRTRKPFSQQNGNVPALKNATNQQSANVGPTSNVGPPSNVSLQQNSSARPVSNLIHPPNNRTIPLNNNRTNSPINNRSNQLNNNRTRTAAHGSPRTGPSGHHSRVPGSAVPPSAGPSGYRNRVPGEMVISSAGVGNPNHQQTNNQCRPHKQFGQSNSDILNQAVVHNFLGIVLKWNPEWLHTYAKSIEENQNSPTPQWTIQPPPILEKQEAYVLVDEYRDFEEYSKQFMLPLLVHETWESCFRDWRQKSLKSTLMSHKVLHSGGQGAHGDKQLTEYVFHGLLSGEDKRRNRHLSEMDLITVRSLGLYEKDKNTGKEPGWVTFLGFVERVTFERNPSFAKMLLEKNKSLGEGLHGTLVAIKFVVQLRSRYFRIDSSKPTVLEFVSSLMTNIRQCQALSYLPKSILCNDILRPKGNKTFYDRPEVMAQSLRNYNRSQIEAICGAAKIACTPTPEPRIFLLQGPPGTGKSHTIVGMINKIFKQKLGKVRICLCAPSNAAVDEVVKRLLRDKKDAAKSGSHTSVAQNIIRIGKLETMNAEVHSCSLIRLLEKNINNDAIHSSRTGGNIPDSLFQQEVKLKKKHRLLVEQQAKSKGDQAQKLKIDIKKLERDMDKLHNNIKQSANPPSLTPEQERRFKYQLLVNAHVIAGTLSGIGHMGIQNILKEFEAESRKQIFDCVIVDEATQATEIDTLIPLQYGISKLILVGDPEQLQATVISHIAAEKKFGQSLFERFYNHFNMMSMNPVHLLDTQYRMHPEICSFPSSYIYSGKIKTAEAVSYRTQGTNLRPYLLFDLRDSQEQMSQCSGSISNELEAQFTVELCQHIKHNASIPEDMIGIIAPYNRQKKLLLDKLREKKMPGIEVHTVDGFQGREKKVIVMSCVRANSLSGGIGFVGNRNRMNVALTRAKYALYLIAHFDSLEANEEWRVLIQNARSRNLIIPVHEENARACIRKCIISKEEKNVPRGR